MARDTAVDYTAQRDAFEAWFQSPLGRVLLADQRRHLDNAVAAMAGAHQLLVAVSHRLPLASSSDFSKRVLTTPYWCRELGEGVVVCDADELPFPSDSMDLVILHHSLDFSDQPHQVVREAARVLRSSGSLVVIGFNPFSIWGARKLVSRRRQAPWSGRFISANRLEDWLSLLQFSVESTDTHFFRPPLAGAGALHRLAGLDRLGERLHLPAGAYYCIRAEKRMPAARVRRLRWRQPKPVVLPVAGAMGSTGLSRRDRQASRKHTPCQDTHSRYQEQ
ncbi:class I SAM-dependent methyltransferase [Marinobacter bohaiensis]|uniref:class I SAM-dependent methyltransferase n=1 Tax=Marinobacter bohaiensis TaxID=2201898 RepID=UPI000DABC3A5|nr:methyltransferase domain-containing protein [Marinobacter bohaiensis]